MKHLNEMAEFEKHGENYAQVMNLHFTCKVCGNDGHSGNDCPRPMKTPLTSTTTTGIVHHREARGGDKHAQHSRVVIISTLLSIRTNLPCENLF